MELKDDNPDTEEKELHKRVRNLALGRVQTLPHAYHSQTDPVLLHSALEAHHHPTHSAHVHTNPHSVADGASVHGSTSDFSVHTGPIDTHTPLGMSSNHSHYIEPRPPKYVTEYESAYTWPADARSSSPKMRALSPQRIQEDVRSASPPLPHSQATTPVRHKQDPTPWKSEDTAKIDTTEIWNSMERALEGLATLGYERTLVDGVIPVLQSRKLAAGIEYAYEHLKKRLLAAHADHVLTSPGISAKGDRLSPQEMEQHQVLMRCQEFVDNVDAIKGQAVVTRRSPIGSDERRHV